jgi:cyclophilin family peptidyl-prolyl cis-trans isomerase
MMAKRCVSVHLAGDACIIPNTREFFIATADHGEWGHSHTVWGQVSSAAKFVFMA